MCDCSLHSIKSRPAKVGDKLTTRDFDTGTRGFAPSEDASVAVCVRPGTELSFVREVTCQSIGMSGWRDKIIKHKTAIFRQINKERVVTHSRCTGISGRPDRAPDMSERRSRGYGSSVVGRAKERRRI